MKCRCLLLLIVFLLMFVLLSGCKDDPKPQFTRIQVTPACGVAPMQVEGYAIVTGGNESGSATGGNNNLDISWDFGDGNSSNTSLAYNQYNQPGDYTVTASAKDPDGAVAVTSFPVRVLADSLVINAFSNAGEATTTADTIQFDLRAESCDINPDNVGDYVKMIYRWRMGDAGHHVYTSRNPVFRYSQPGEYTVRLAVTYPAWAVTRYDVLNVTVGEAP